jgi:exodeoxyribonuclease-3
MKIYSWNVNGIRAVQKKGFVDWVIKEKPDILCLQETKALREQLDDEIVNIEGYTSHFHSAEKKGYSGVAVYTRTEPASYSAGMGIEKYDTEGRVQVLDYGDFVLINAYFPNGQMSDERLQYKLDFNEAMLKFCNGLVKNKKNVILCGDYNTAHNEIDLKHPKANEERSGFLPIEREWIDRFISDGYVDTFRELYPDLVKYSWWSYRMNARKSNAGWRIDYFFVSREFMGRVKDAQILNEVMGSDHCPVLLEIKY